MKKQHLYGVIAILIWATAAPTAKALLSGLPNYEAIVIPCLFAAAFMLTANTLNGKIHLLRRCTAKELAIMAGLGVLGPFLNAAFYYEGLTRLSSQEACVMNYLWPIMLVLFSVLLLGERMTGAKAAAMLCSFAGVAVMSSGGAAQSGGGRPMGIVCCILGAVCYGLFSVLNKKADLDQTVTMMVLWPTTAACALLAGALTETWVPIRGMQWLGLAWLGIASNAVAYLLWAWALSGERETAFIANLAYLTPFLSVVISAIFLKEGLQLRALAALVLIVGGILLQNLHRPKRAHIPATRRVPAAKEETP